MDYHVKTFVLFQHQRYCLQVIGIITLYGIYVFNTIISVRERFGDDNFQKLYVTTNIKQGQTLVKSAQRKTKVRDI